MAELVARGSKPAEEQRWTLPQGAATLGRHPTKCDLVVPWDRRISGVHLLLSWGDGKLRVRRLEPTVNPVLLEGTDQGFEEFVVLPGQVFSIGATSFTVQTDIQPAAPGGRSREANEDIKDPDFQSTSTLAALRQVRYTDADRRIEILASLPELIRFSPSDQELESRVAEVLVQGIATADVAGVVRLTSGEGAEPEVEVRASATRQVRGRKVSSLLKPSRRLVQAAVHGRQAVFYLWDRVANPGFTVHPEIHWALCVPLPETHWAGWALYAAGPELPLELAANDAVPTSDMKFAGVVADIFASLREVSKLQAEQVKMNTSLALAHEIQAGFFPRKLPKVEGYEIAAGSRPADATGGDYYDVLSLASGQVGLVVADVCGHGLGPSLLMASLRATLRGFAVREPAPEVLVSDIGQALHDDLSPRFRFITLLYGALDPVQHRFSYANAGHGPVVLHFQSADDQFRSLADDDRRGCPLGILRDRYQSCDPIGLAPGDMLILGSDGIVEARRRDHEQFGMERLCQLIRQLKNRPLQEILKEIMEATTSFGEGEKPDDDLTLLLVRRNEPRTK